MKQPIVSASIMCANLLELGKEVSRLQKVRVNWLHVDVMDGQFVPNIVIGCPDLVEDLRPITNLPLDVHLMIRQPERHIEAFAKADADIIVFHWEATDRPSKVLAQIKNLEKKPGIALNPDTPVSVLKAIFEGKGIFPEMILIMTVYPGFAGQEFIPETLSKIAELRKMLKDRDEIDIQVDGGLTPERIRECAQAGANVFVAGTSSIFERGLGLRDDAKKIINEIRSFPVVR